MFKKTTLASMLCLATAASGALAQTQVFNLYFARHAPQGHA